MRANDLAIKIKVLSYYGGQCVCCNTKVLSFLTLDHIDGGGEKHRKEIKKPCGVRFYRWLIANHYPEGYQVLCFNCHMAKTWEGECTYHPLILSDEKQSQLQRILPQSPSAPP